MAIFRKRTTPDVDVDDTLTRTLALANLDRAIAIGAAVKPPPPPPAMPEPGVDAPTPSTAVAAPDVDAPAPSTVPDVLPRRPRSVRPPMPRLRHTTTFLPTTVPEASAAVPETTDAADAAAPVHPPRPPRVDLSDTIHISDEAIARELEPDEDHWEFEDGYNLFAWFDDEMLDILALGDTPQRPAIQRLADGLLAEAPVTQVDHFDDQCMRIGTSLSVDELHLLLLRVVRATIAAAH